MRLPPTTKWNSVKHALRKLVTSNRFRHICLDHAETDAVATNLGGCPFSRRRHRHAENARLRAQLKRVTEERDILKKAAAYFARELP